MGTPPRVVSLDTTTYALLTNWQPRLHVQDRDQQGRRTPRWRGVTLLHELRSKGIPVAMASDNTRDQFFAYGDLDMLEVFNQVLNRQYWYSW